jgi:acyl-coenzyme A thioesterase PaaI-like protein
MRKLIQRKIESFIRYYPPLLGAGINVKRISADYREIDVEMKLRFWNANYVGTHYGGSLYSMADPFYMLMLIQNLGRDYIVWDKAASIRFRKPGRGTVVAQFRISTEQLDEIRRILETEEKTEPVFTVEIKDESGTVIAEVQKTLYVRRKSDPPRV